MTVKFRRMPDVVMPRLADSMEEGTILRWLKTDGDEIAVGDELVEIETDKATMTHEAEAAGVLHVVAGEGATLKVGEVMATVGEGERVAGEDGGAAEPASAGDRAGAGDGEAPPAPEPAGVTLAGGADAPAVAADAAPVAAGPGAGANGGPKASPVARRLARERGLDLTSVRGTGPGGRIVRADVEQAGAGAPAAAAPASAPPAAAAPAAAASPATPPPATTETGTAKGDVRVQELTRTQSLIARRMAESKATIPDFTLRATADMGAAVVLREQLRAAVGDGRPVPSYNDMVVKAAGLALAAHPKANGSYRDGRFELFSRVNVGVAVAANESLVVPTVFDADRKPLGQIAEETRALAERVRQGAITPPELSGGTFTLSNLGMYGMRSITPVINPPQAAILGVGALERRAVVRDGELVAGHELDLTLVCDHRILYGADAALFLGRVRELLEQPLALVL